MALIDGAASKSRGYKATVSMNIPTGTLLGRYEIRQLIGAGGMGEVYRATDKSLGRDVAIKVLPPDLSLNADRMQRFEQEARATSVLNHPNVVAIFDFGTFNGSPYIVSELLTGETLRDRLITSALPVRKAIEYAVQVARGLAAAHEKGIIHRDLKPENVFITSDGHAKILDFGLAKLIDDPVLPGDLSSEAETKRISTQPGTVLGSAGYMSPEQVRGQATDSRSDIFSFGAVLYEMVTGARAFRGDSSVETMHAILKNEPPPMAMLDRGIAPALERFIAHCLEKLPKDRFQSARDLAFNLESITSQSGIYSSITGPQLAEQTGGRKWPMLAGLLLLSAGLLALVFFLGRKTSTPQLPAFTQLTFRRGSIYTARFTPDGKGIYFSAAWNGNPLDISSMRVESPEVQNVGAMPNTQLLSISPTGEMAVLLRTQWLFHFVNEGTLARMPLTGGAPREVLEHVQEADWKPTGNDYAVVRISQGQNFLEYPIGKKLYSTEGYISNMRFSPSGDKIAFLDHPVHGDSRGSVMVVDLNGATKKLTEDWSGEDGLAWSPSGDEVWFTATKAGESQQLYAVTLSGKQRVIFRTLVNIRLHDISSEGEVLLSGSHESTPITGSLPSDSRERDLSWLPGVRVTDLSPDGTSFIFNDYGQGSGSNYAIYLGRTDGSPGVRLGDGYGLGRSPDGKWVISVLINPPQIILLPTGAGQAKTLERFGIEQYSTGASWLPDGKSIVFIGKEKGHQTRTYVQSIDGGQPRAITPEGIEGYLVSPDGKLLLGNLSLQLASASGDVKEKKALYPLDGGAPRSIPGLEEGDRVIRWGTDAQSLYVYRDRERPLKIYKLNIGSGHKELAKEISPTDPAGVLGPINVLLTPDGEGYVYAFARQLSDLYLVKDLK